MSNELIAIIGVGVTLAGIILYSQDNMRSETKAEFKAVRSEIQSLRAETQAEFKTVRSEIQSLRAETRAEFNAVRAETRAEFTIHLAAINRLRDDVNQLQARMAHQEGLMEGLREAVIGLRDAITGSGELVAGPG